MITYKATNTLNGRFYLGSTIDFEKRKKQHLASTANYPFQNALRKNPNLFEWEFIEDDSEEPVLEQALLDKWFGTEMCYNLRPLATGGQGPATEETKQKMSNSHKGKRKSDQTKVAISRSRRGMKFTEEHKQNISYGKTGQSHDSWNKGKSWFYNISTLETKMSFNHPGDGWDKGRRPKCL